MPRVSDGKLLEQLFKAATSGTKVPEVASPQSSLYGVFGQNYGAALQGQAANDPYFGPVAMTRLNDMRMEEMDAYEQQLAAAQAAQLRAQEVGANAELDRTIIENSPKDYYGVFNRGTSPTTGGYGGLKMDPVLSAAANAVKLDTETAGNFKTRAEGYKAGAEAGMVTTPEQYGLFTRNPLETPESAVTYLPGMTPSDATSRINSRSVEDELMLIEAKERYKAQYGTDPDEDEVEWKQEINPYNGVKEWVAKGTRRGFEEGGLSPPGSSSPRPRAGAQAPGASATQGSVKPVADAKSVALQLHPQIKITDHRRDPNSSLGRANPDSWHNKSGAAVDSKAIPGMTFQQYVQSYRDQGYQIIEARDEYTNPSKHATGKHWHVVLGEKRGTKVAGTRTDNIRTIATRAQKAGMTIKQVGDRVFITSSDGSQTRVYDVNGTRLK